jgi:hypothetical protein
MLNPQRDNSPRKPGCSMTLHDQRMRLDPCHTERFWQLAAHHQIRPTTTPCQRPTAPLQADVDLRPAFCFEEA